MTENTTGKSVVEERDSILTSLVVAYLKDRKAIQVMMADGTHRYFHGGLPQGFSAEWSHVEALSYEGLLYVQPGAQRATWSITIPTAVLRRFEGTHVTQDLLSGDATREIQAIQQVFNIVTGGGGNFSTAARDATQNVGIGVSPGDTTGLIQALTSLDGPNRYIENLDESLKDVSDHTKRTARVWEWFGHFTSDAGSGAAGAGLVAVIPSVFKAIEAFVGAVS